MTATRLSSWRRSEAAIRESSPRESEHRYSYADLRVRSSVELPELAAVADGRARDEEIGFRLLEDELPEPPADAWLAFPHPPGSGPPLSVATTPDGYLLRFPSRADFLVDRNGLEVAARPVPSCSPRTLHHLLLDQVLPRVLAHRGRMVVHAGAVILKGSAVAFLGESGCGKSTLVASLDRAGSSALSDDGLVVVEGADRVSLCSFYPGLRLWPPVIRGLGILDAETSPMADDSEKVRVRPAGGAMTGTLGAIFILEPVSARTSSAEIVATRLSARDTCVELIRSSFLLDLGDTTRAAEVLQRAADIAERVPAYALRYPLRFDRLPEVHETIRSCVGAARADDLRSAKNADEA